MLAFALIVRKNYYRNSSMNLDNELQQLWQSEQVPMRLVLILSKVRRHRRWWLLKRAFEAAVALFVTGHYITHHGSEIGHWLYLPIALVFFPALWVLVYKNAAIARAHANLGVNSYLQVRVRQINGSLQEIRFMLASALGLIGYAVSCWWVIRIVNADENAHLAANGLLFLTAIAALLIAVLGFWRRKICRRELAAVTESLRELVES
jgi:hypothetical protein